MSQVNHCPKCGAALPTHAPSGICPKCLLQVGINPESPKAGSENALSPTINRANGFDLPDPDALASQFQDLEIEQLLGQGGMGAVYKARQTKLDRYVALKIIRPDSANDPSFAQRFNREARTLARLNHPNIVAIYDFGELASVESDGTHCILYYFLMEFVDGANLRQLIHAGELAAGQALGIVSQICEALQFAHDEGIVHRDIKPENILVDKRGRVKIADFGLAKLLSDEVADFSLTGTHQVMGTPRYMAPEQMEGTRAVDHRADIYSLGVVFYEILTGELPLGRFDPPSKKAPVNHQWDDVVLRALEKEPNMRYQQASEVKMEVDRVSEFGASPAIKKPPKKPVDAAPLAIPHYGLLILGSVMMGLGLPLLAVSLLTPAHIVFVWVGMGIAIGGAAVSSAFFFEDTRLPAGTPVNYGMLILGGMMSFIGLFLLLSGPVVSMNFAALHPANVFIWIGIGLIIGGGGVCCLTWEAQRPESDDQEEDDY